ncbi:cryptochrome/photolyase family protein [Curvivirga aplysinae]|uniref:cryptochrome/photolyase family protein n=1 Tax=Curvivirga aplysinae TaxID=2529852 RepID=UPI0012BCAF4F|nr:cryptochrome/photolyase family protein [Curvivirga aplysinae]MTI10468.1 cryptochrome/photolyase family protein [Curvivirga aplysinae]
MSRNLHLILGDQLSETISCLEGFRKDQDMILMCEVIGEATYVKHHKKKIAFLFSAMRHFAKKLKDNSFNIQYVKIDAADNTGTLFGEVKRITENYWIENIVLTFPGEYRLLSEMLGWEDKLSITVEIRPDTRFLCQPNEFAQWAKDRKQLRMEYFYRDMRKRYNILMDNGMPVGGKWNYDSENRKPPADTLSIPSPFKIQKNQITIDVLDLVDSYFGDHFGNLKPFHFAVDRKQALKVLEHFIQHRLPMFGDYQDAMIQNEPWMYHSHLSFYMNCGLLLPLECIRAAEHAYYKGHAPLNAVEGFIRQILGWREYIRGIYWLKMPDYGTQNFFNAKASLPSFYWSAQTKMNCLRQCILETKQNAYAHHIQRLMVLGNFALLAGINPDEVNEWFMIVYADAYEWVELPNVTGMILFADGGFLASKPYAAGGSYIQKMSNYCQNCSYKVTKKNGPDACPFNYLYWDFLSRNREKLQSNHRIGMMYKTYDRMNDEKKQAIARDSESFLEALT